ncbi:sulfite exporter TauE/SafE family protein [Paraburkholderia susongensis]|uniref:Probable membrane transporter protein n=1 Tax=Paraburkholderia susongensis TaxID=1515439 RepID=A0A1X7LWG7_9BURK|nr:sulfite exporter TauE/SafE family protein [Paraburkholderia susongensis]SMG57807.1 hypothetical protein SAMN06265784_11069 [Paraburkholderia susongensis]
MSGAAFDLHYTLWLFAVSLGASALGGMLGMASGIFIVPILTMFGHLDIHVAIGASIVSVIACSCGGAAPFLRGRFTNVRLAVVLETATTLGALSGVLLSGLVPVTALYFIFGVILILSAQQMLARRADPAITVNAATTAGALATAGAGPSRPRSWGASLQLDSSYPDRVSGRDIAYRVQRIPLGLSLMYGAGLISALLGIGSGVLKIPAMDTALRLPIKVSSATSNFMIGVTATASAGAYFLRGEIVTAIAGPVALGSVAGAALGARLLMRVSNERLRVLFVAVLALLAVQMLLEAFGIHLFGASA